MKWKTVQIKYETLGETIKKDLAVDGFIENLFFNRAQ